FQAAHRWAFAPIRARPASTVIVPPFRSACFSTPESSNTSSIRRILMLFPQNDSPQQTPLSRVKIGARMQAEAIIPENEIAGCPDMLVDEFSLLLEVEQIAQQLIAFRLRNAFDPVGHQTIDIESLPTCDGVHAHHWMDKGLRIRWRAGQPNG